MFSLRLLIVSCAATLLYCAACQREPASATKNLNSNQSPLDSTTLKQLELGIKYAKEGDTLKVEKIRQDLNADNLPVDSVLAMFFHRLGTVYYNSANYEKAITIYQKTMAIWERLLNGRPHKRASFTLYNLGSSFHHTFQFEKAHEAFQKALFMQKQIFQSDDTDLADTYREIGNTYEDATDYFNALDYLIQAEKIYSNNNVNSYNWAECCSYIGINYRKIHNYEKAIVFYQKGIDIALKAVQQSKDSSLIFKNRFEAGDIFSNLGITLRILNSFDKAIFAFNNSLSLQKDSQHDTYFDIALTYWRQNKTKETLHNLLKAKDLCTQKNAPITSASVENLFAEINLKNGQTDAALAATDTALQFLLPKYQTNAPLSIEVFETALSRSYLIETLELRAKIFAKRYQLQQNTGDLNAALQTYQATDLLINAMLNDLKDDNSRYFWTEKVNGIYENGIKTALQLYDKTKAPTYQTAALAFAASGKSFTLRQALKNNHALQFADVPKETLQREQNLKARLAFCQKQYADNREDAAIATAFLDAKQQFITFQSDMEKQFPRYFQLKYAANAPLSIPDIQKQLAPDMLSVEYFLGDSSLFVFAVSPTQSVVFEQKTTPDFLQNIQNLKNSISGNWQNTAQTAESAYLKSAHELYKILLEAPLSKLNAEGKLNRLRIVTDGVLGYIPFDVLVKNFDPTKDNWRSADWLINYYAVSYATSNTLINDPSVSAATTRHFGGFGISYLQNTIARNDNRKAAPLPEAPEEVRKIYDKLNKNGNIWLDAAANKASFLKNAPNCDVLHLAMHGYIDEQNSLNSGLIFATQNAADTSPYLTGFDLYALKLDAQMAVLSACQTGDGALQRHEGVMSLARSFAFAGCRSIVMSLWQIPDRSTADILSNFYDHLKKGLPKDRALQQAKRDFLQNCPPSQRTPERWAACVVIGDVVPLEFAANWNWIWWAIGLVCLGVLIWFFVKKRLKY